jgi:hypothetical protein
VGIGADDIALWTIGALLVTNALALRARRKQAGR